MQLLTLQLLGFPVVTTLSAATPATITVKWTAGAHIVRGRLSLILSRDLSDEPRLTIGSSFSNSGQIFAFDVDASAGAASFPSPLQASFPFDTMEQLPAGTVSVQAVLQPYELYNRSDGSSLWLPTWNALTYSEDYDSYGWANVTTPFGGHKGLSAEGALYSVPVQRSLPFAAASSKPLEITLTQRVPKFPARPADTKLQKYVTLQSPMLSKFWGRPVNVSAWVTLPAGFDAHPKATFPLIINHGHYSYQRLRGWSDSPPSGPVKEPRPVTGNPDDCHYCSSGGGCCENCIFSDSFQQRYANYFTRNWTSLDPSVSAFHGSRVLLVRVQTPNPFFDDSYAVNSANIGPYGDALTYELIPLIEQRFRGIGEGWARGTYGGSTGAWSALAVQVKYPREYNGAIACAPDPIDFRALLPLNIYASSNAFRSSRSSCGMQLKDDVTGLARTYTGKMLASLEDAFRFEAAIGGAISGGQIGVWMAVYGPRDAATGLPKPLWDASGEIDRSVAEYWRENYDLSHLIQRDWSTENASLLQGKLHVWVGSMDAYYLDAAVFLTQNRVEALSPSAEADFRYGTSRGRGYSHAWKGSNSTSAEVSDLTMHQRLIPLLVQGFLDRAPPGADVSSWRY